MSGVKFPLGQLVATPAALAAFEKAGDPFVMDKLVARHQAGDWGELSAEDRRSNDEGLGAAPDRLHSNYVLADGQKIWIITEWDRSVTTVLLPEDY